MENKTAEAEADVLNFMLRGNPVYLCLFTGDPGEAGSTATEVPTTSGYARQLITFGAPVGTPRACANTNAPKFGPASTSYGEIGYGAIAKSNVRGTADLIYYGPLGTPRTVGENLELEFQVDAVIIRER